MASSGGRGAAATAAALIARRAALSSTSTSAAATSSSSSAAPWLSSRFSSAAAAVASTSYSPSSIVPSSFRSFSVAATTVTAGTTTSLLGGAQRHHQKKNNHHRFFSALPPHTSLDMPALSPTMSTGNIASWKKNEGDSIAAGDIIAEIETDKATMEWEAQDEGVLAKIVVPAGARDIPVGTPVAIVVDEASDVAAFANYEAGSSASSSSSAPAAAAVPAAAAASSSSNFPPHTLMGLPALSPTMASGNIASWKKKAGDSVSAGDVIAEVETDKATMEWEAQDDGVIAKILVEAGVSDVPVGTPVAVVVDDEGMVAAFAGYTAADAAAKEGGGAAASAPADAAPAAAAISPSTPAAAAAAAPLRKATLASGPRVIASPYAKKLAADAGVSLVGVPGTGPAGRVVAADVADLLASGGGKAASSLTSSSSASSGVEIGTEYDSYADVPHSQIRRVTANRLLQSKQQVPHYYLTVDVRLDALLETRARLNEARAAMAKKGDEEGVSKLSVNDFVLKAAALALKAVPGVNAAWSSDFTRVYKNVDINVAVQAPSGLMVPLLIDADRAGLGEISSRVRALAAAARDGNLKPEQMAPGTFTVSNLGMFGVEQFAAIVNPPQAAILAVGGARPVLVPSSNKSNDGGNGFESATMLSATLSCDHRVVDGAMGAQWLQAFKRFMEQPLTMLL